MKLETPQSIMESPPTCCQQELLPKESKACLSHEQCPQDMVLFGDGGNRRINRKRRRQDKFSALHSAAFDATATPKPRRRRNGRTRMLRSRSRSVTLWAIVLLQLLGIPNTCHLQLFIHAAVSCDPAAPNDNECASLLRPGSTCSFDGFCTNPFQQGCLRNYLGPDQIPDMRTCNSDDDDAAYVDANGIPLCTPSPLGYSEIRILAQNWETSMFTSWILQIVLSELMQVPATLELSELGRDLNFYAPTNPFSYGALAYDFDALRTANAYLVTADPVGTITSTTSTVPPEKGMDRYGRDTAGDCPREWRVPPDNSDESWDYKSCAHVMVEAWSGQAPAVKELSVTQVVEPPEGTGVVGKLGWFVPKYLVEQDPSLAHWLGLSGEANRRKVAELFRVPTTYGQFCSEIVPHNCTVPTLFASRPPNDEAEASSYFVAGGVFNGYFRFSPENDCDANPTTCVGHITDVPCEWSTFAVPQAYHLNISVTSRGPLEPNQGYSYGDLLDIWAAANATKSAVLMYWWYPDAVYQSYMGLPAEMQAVQLPPPRQECVTNRVTPEQKCSNTPLEERVGDPRGACDSEPHSLQKLTVGNLYPYLNGFSGKSADNSTNSNTTSSDENISNNNNAQQAQTSTWNPAFKSPAYDGIEALSINELNLGVIMEAWESRGLDKWNYDPREAVCEWVVDNLPTLRTWIPRTYPRKVQTDAYNHNREVLFGLALGVGSFVAVLVLATAALTYWWRRRPLLVFAQVGFLYILLLGLFFVVVGAVLEALEPNDWSCMAQYWFITLGYTLELVPLIVKVSAIHRMMQAARKMRRITLNHRQLYGTVFIIALVTAIVLSIWTIVDPSQRRDQITLHPERVTERGETVVTVTYFCSSEHNDTLWRYLSLSWQLILLLSATVLSFHTRKTRKDLNESSSLGTLIYSHFFFVMLRCITLVLEETGETVDKNTLEGLRSLIFSVDVFVALNIYFTPKMYSLFKYDDEHFKTVMSNQRKSSVRSMPNRGGSFNGSLYTGGSMRPGSLLDDTESGIASKKRRSSKFSASQLQIGKLSTSNSGQSSGSFGFSGENDHDPLATIHSASASNSGVRPSESSTNANENRLEVSEKAKPPARMSSFDSSCISISSDENESFKAKVSIAKLDPNADADEESTKEVSDEKSDIKEQYREKMANSIVEAHRKIPENDLDSMAVPLRNLQAEVTMNRRKSAGTNNGDAQPTTVSIGTLGDTTRTSLSSGSSPEHHLADSSAR